MIRKIILWLWVRWCLNATERKAWAVFKQHLLMEDHAPAWDEDNAEQLEAFFKTHTGQRLVTFLNHQEAYHNSGAVLTVRDPQYACGFAAGYRGCVAELFSKTQRTTADQRTNPQLEQDLAEAGLSHLQN